MAELDKLELLRLYLDDEANPQVNQGQTLFQDYQLTGLLDEAGDDVNLAAARGWRIKAARVAEWYNVSLDGAELTRGQAFRHALDMAKAYQNESSGEIISVKMDTEFTTATGESEF